MRHTHTEKEVLLWIDPTDKNQHKHLIKRYSFLSNTWPTQWHTHTQSSASGWHTQTIGASWLLWQQAGDNLCMKVIIFFPASDSLLFPFISLLCPFISNSSFPLPFIISCLLLVITSSLCFPPLIILPHLFSFFFLLHPFSSLVLFCSLLSSLPFHLLLSHLYLHLLPTSSRPPSLVSFFAYFLLPSLITPSLLLSLHSPPVSLLLPPSYSSPHSLSYFSSSSAPLRISTITQFRCVFPFQTLSPCITSEFLLGVPVDYLCALVSICGCSVLLPSHAQTAAKGSVINIQGLRAFGAGDIRKNIVF